jgi:NAD(P)H-flavin reductase
MIKYTLEVLDRLGFKEDTIYTTLERRMKCGIGKCGRCNIGEKFVCIDGPVFSLKELNNLSEPFM